MVSICAVPVRRHDERVVEPVVQEDRMRYVMLICSDDERRVFVTGYSNGAFLASKLACVDADRIAAIAPVSGLRDPADCAPKRPVPAVTFHGTGDEWVAFTGGLGPCQDCGSR